jgi:GT2 family glycosyltransferase
MPGGIDVVIVTYNSAATVAGVLVAALASPRVGGAIVVDNASSDGSAEAARTAGARTVVRNPVNVGFAAAVNRGLRECDGDYVLLLNPDATIEPPALELLVAALEESPAAVMAGPVLVAQDGRLELGARRFSTTVNRLLWHLPLPRRPQWSTPQYLSAAEMAAAPAPLPVDYLWGAALLVRRRFLSDIGGLDERFFLYSEDEDLGRRAQARGCRSFLVPRARAVHVGGVSTPDAALALARVITANALLLEKWEGRRAAQLYRCGIGPVLGVRAALLRVAGRGAEADLAARTCAALGTAGARAQALGYLAGTWRLGRRVVTKHVHPLADDRADRAGSAAPVAPGVQPRALHEQRYEAAVGAADEPLVSIILPVYNAASTNPGYLRDALESVVAQGAAPLELVVVDDGSTDETPDLVTAFLDAHPQLAARVVSKANGGQSSARNVGARMSRGAWLAFLDQDDMWTKDHAQVVLPYLTEGVDLVYTDADTVDEAGRPMDVGIHRSGRLGGRHPKACVDDVIFQDVFVMPGVMTIRRELFDQVGGFDEGLSGYEDDDLFVRCFEAGNLRYVALSTLLWRIHSDSASHTDRMIVSGLRYWRKLVERYAVGPQASSVSRRLTLRFVRVFLSYASIQLVVGNPLFERNLAAAESLLPHLGAVDRVAFEATRWAWHRKTLAARCARSWYLSGMQTATGDTVG